MQTPLLSPSKSQGDADLAAHSVKLSWPAESKDPRVLLPLAVFRYASARFTNSQAEGYDAE
jgi:hypothetical protein